MPDLINGQWLNEGTDGGSWADIKRDAQAVVSLPSLRSASAVRDGDGSVDVSVCTSRCHEWTPSSS